MMLRASAVKIYFIFCVVISLAMTYANFRGFYIFEQFMSQVQIQTEE